MPDNGGTDWASDEPGAGAAIERPATVVLGEALLPGRRRDGTSRWHVLRTKSRQEKVLDAALRAIGLSSYLPLHAARRRRGGRFVESILPVFPGYLFLWGDRDEVFLADRTRRVAGVIDVTDQAMLESELTNVCRALARGAVLDPHETIAQGVRVRVVSGPFEGVEGVVTSRAAPDRLILRVRILNTAASLDVAGEIVEPIEF